LPDRADLCFGSVDAVIKPKVHHTVGLHCCQHHSRCTFDLRLDTTEMPHLLLCSGLGRQEAYSSTGYSLSIVWQPDYDMQWNSLGCLDSLVSLKINGTLPDLPATWAENSSFPLLQVQCLWLWCPVHLSNFSSTKSLMCCVGWIVWSGLV